MPLITFRDVSHTFGVAPILDQVNFSVERGERICLIGRNGTGKSSLLKMISGDFAPDAGEIARESGLVVYALPQEVPTNIAGTIFEVVLSGLNEAGVILAQYEALLQQNGTSEAYFDKLYALQNQIEAKDAWLLQTKVHTIISKLNLDGGLEFSDLSGGMKRRVLLAKALVSEPDILLLDEPTNHLDVEAVQWLEEFLLKYKGSILFISHDRTFLQALATRIFELDRGRLISFAGGYQKFLAHKATLLSAEAQHDALFDKRLAQEEVWIRQGIKARRTRNEGRVRALEQMRRDRQERRGQQSRAKLSANTHAVRAGKKLLVVDNIGVNYDDIWLFKDFSTEIWRGDKIGILGPNGCGKSTLLNVILGKLEPTTGSVKARDDLLVAYFDQLGHELDESLSIQDNVGDGSEYVEINGEKKHIYSYLQDFLFASDRVRTPVKKLSGGEKHRVLLAKILSKPSDILVLDEPTNDLDIETLELLEELLVKYTGTVLLVSHDRTFLNNVVTSTIAFESGELNEYVGGYNDWLRQRDT